jgi:hypothetical protein
MEGNKLLGRNSSSDDDTGNGIYTGRLDRKSAREPSFSRFRIFRCCLEVLLIVCLLGTIGLLLRNDTRKASAGSWQVWPAGSDYNHFVPHGKSSLSGELSWSLECY